MSKKQYGTIANAEEVEQFIDFLFEQNHVLEQSGQAKVPICIWGDHGIGKTELVRSMANKKGYAWAYLAPAQFEEVGDLIGMPIIENGKTSFAIPEWTPQQKGPGIFLIDDFNRADERIIRALMQLLQDYKLSSWAMPRDWQIVLTANPDNGDYSVTPLDLAVVTRMQHIAMRWDANAWVKWAQQNDIDERGINFVLSFPEACTGERTTARSLTQFFNSIKAIDDLEQAIDIVKMLADASLDEHTTTAFIAFIDQKLSKIPSLQSVFDKGDFKGIKNLVQQDITRLDILTTFHQRLLHELRQKEMPDNWLETITDYLQEEWIPADLKIGLAKDIANIKGKASSIISNPTIGLMLLDQL